MPPRKRFAIPKPGSVSAADIREFVQDALAGRLYSHVSVPANLLPQVFMPILFGALEGITNKQAGDIVLVGVVGRDTANTMSINGYPIFWSFRIWHRKDYLAAVEKVRKIKAVMDEELGVDPHERDEDE